MELVEEVEDYYDIDDVPEYDYDPADLFEFSKKCIICDKTKYTKVTSMCKSCSIDMIISKTGAKNKYSLKEDDLEDMISYDIKTQWGYGTMYFLLDVRTRAIQKKYDRYPSSKEEYVYYLNLFENDKNRKSIKRKTDMEQRKIERRQLLADMLAKHDLIIRDDSYMCQKYISGSIKDPKIVVEEMVLMDFLHRECHYALECRHALDKLHASIRLEREDGEIYDREDVANMIEEEKSALKIKLLKKYVEKHGLKSIPRILRRKYKLKN